MQHLTSCVRMHDYDGMSTQMECSDVSQIMIGQRSGMYFWQLWRSKDIVNITFRTLCIRLL